MATYIEDYDMQSFDHFFFNPTKKEDKDSRENMKGMLKRFSTSCSMKLGDLPETLKYDVRATGMTCTT